MKNIKLVIGLFVGINLLFASCEKTVNEPVISASNPTSLDEKAGTWKTYILASPTEVAVNAPKLATDAAYLKELDSLKNKIDPEFFTPGMTSAKQEESETKPLVASLMFVANLAAFLLLAF